MVCLDSAINFIEAPATTLKKFVAKGGAKKDEVRLEVYKKWGFEHASNDAVDAYLAAQFGRAVLGWVKTTEADKALIAKCTGAKKTAKFDKFAKTG